MLRIDGLENLTLTGTFEGKKEQREETGAVDGRWLSERCTKHQEVELIEIAKDRESWQNRIAHAIGYGI